MSDFVAKSKVSTAARVRFPVNAKHLPATQLQLMHTRDELRKETRELRAEMNSGFEALDSKIEKQGADIRTLDAKVDKTIAEMRAGFQQLDAKIEKNTAELTGRFEGLFHKLDAKVERSAAETSRVLALMEEQRSENKAMMEHLNSLFDRQERVEMRMDQVERTVGSLPLKKSPATV